MPHLQTNTGITYTISGLSILFILFFISFICYFRVPLGDDVLSQLTNGGNYYIDGFTGSLGIQIKDFSELYQSVRWHYFNWGGRIIGITMLPLLSLFGLTFTALFTGGCYIYLIILAGMLIFGNNFEILKHPLVIILLFLLLFYLNPSINFLLMWTFTSIYIVSLILLGTYYYIFQENLKLYNLRFPKKNIILINLLGFFAGLTHEVFSFAILSLVLYITLKEIIKKQLPFRKILYHSGLIISTILCITAPGNFTRLSGSHDAIRMSQSIFIKLYNIVKSTVYMVVGGNTHYISFIIITILIAIIITKYTSKITNIKSALLSFIITNSTDLLFLFYLIIIWSFFPYMGSYGTILFLFWFCVLIFKNIYLNKSGTIDIIISKFEKSLMGLFITILIVIILCLQNYSWMSSMANTTIERRIIIRNAVIENVKQVNVPLYEDKYSNRFNFYNYNNYTNNENMSEHYFKYFGVYMIPSQSIQ